MVYRLISVLVLFALGVDSGAYHRSLSMLSPNPGVSTTVNATLTPSSSNSIRHQAINDTGNMSIFASTTSCPPSPAKGITTANRERQNLPTVIGLICIPGSRCAIFGSTGAAWSRTLDSHRVLTNVVRPVPEVPLKRR